MGVKGMDSSRGTALSQGCVRGQKRCEECGRVGNSQLVIQGVEFRACTCACVVEHWLRWSLLCNGGASDGDNDILFPCRCHPDLEGFRNTDEHKLRPDEIQIS